MAIAPRKAAAGRVANLETLCATAQTCSQNKGPMITVFLGSTYEDLREHRQAVMETVYRIGSLVRWKSWAVRAASTARQYARCTKDAP
jgi:hypothetical protein